MKNPWIKKNPFMSMWLSGANAIAGSARNQAAAQAKRQAATMMNQGIKEMVGFWSGAAMGSPPAKKRKRAR